MKKIKGFADHYCITEDARVINLKTNKELKPKNSYSFRLKDDQGKYVSVSLKELYRRAFDKEYCIDRIEDLEGELWRAVPRTNNCYFCSNKGRIKSLKGYEAIIMKPSLLNNYPRVQIYLEDNVRKDVLVHVLAAICWLEQPLQSPLVEYEIHHIDQNKENSQASNLCYMKKEDHRKLHKTLRIKGDNSNGCDR